MPLVERRTPRAGRSLLRRAQLTTLADVKAKNGAQLSAEELKQLMPANPGGQYTAVGEQPVRGHSLHRRIAAAVAQEYLIASSAGTWRVTDTGRLCVTIKWTVAPEDWCWCRCMFKAGDKYYGVGKVEGDGPASEFQFSK